MRLVRPTPHVLQIVVVMPIVLSPSGDALGSLQLSGKRTLDLEQQSRRLIYVHERGWGIYSENMCFSRWRPTDKSKVSIHMMI